MALQEQAVALGSYPVWLKAAEKQASTAAHSNIRLSLKTESFSM